MAVPCRTDPALVNGIEKAAQNSRRHWLTWRRRLALVDLLNGPTTSGSPFGSMPMSNDLETLRAELGANLVRQRQAIAARNGFASLAAISPNMRQIIDMEMEAMYQRWLATGDTRSAAVHPTPELDHLLRQRADLEGPDPRSDRGDGAGEFWVNVPAEALPALAFALLEEKYRGRSGAVDEFKRFCIEHGITHERASWTGIIVQARQSF